MRYINQTDIQEIIVGANFLGTGGGGSLADAQPFLRRILNPVKLISLNELSQSDEICTVFGIGGKQTVDPIRAASDAFRAFTKTGYSVSAIVPVEVGAESIATAIFVTSTLQIPLLDSDIVGLRSSPEVFLETISLANIERTPCAISDDKGNTALIMNTQSVEKLETFLRNFAVAVGGDAFVAGYPMKKQSIKNILPKSSITITQNIGKILLEQKNKKSLSSLYDALGVYYFDAGVIVNTIQIKSNGFESGEYMIQSNTASWKVLYKNENLILLKNNKVILTCPDSVILLNLETFQGINNFEINNKKRVAVLGKKAIPIWRTKKGKRLFSPKTLGFSYRQKLLA